VSGTAPSLPELLDDLASEHEALEGIIAAISDEDWDVPTPAQGWVVRDQISHLAFFDDVARLAVADPPGFSALVSRVLEPGADPMAEHLGRGRSMSGRQLLDWWREARQGMLSTFAGLDPDSRIAWFGPAMGVRSFVSARLMETWAHGYDVADALGIVPVPTARLRHVAQLGVRARGFSYAVHGRELPTAHVSVELEGPGGENWSWGGGGDGGSHVITGMGRSDLVRGPALDFCLVVTQRRNIADTALVIEGPAAQEWMQIAQAFAGPPGPGRPAAGASRRI
jgi:uncharacterized protein (TIGR03084 family)